MGAIFDGIFGGGGDKGDGGAAARQQAEEERKAALRSKVNSMFGIGDVDPATKAALEAEETQLGDSTRTYHTTALQRAYDDAMRATKFGAIRGQGNALGSAYADSVARVNDDNATGSTRIADAVTQAISGLRAGRDQVRGNAMSLINAGSGDDAVAAAQSGLKDQFNAVSSANKQNLFSDLFSNLAMANAGNNANNSNAAAMAYYQGKKTGLPTPATGSGSTGTLIRGFS